MIQNTPNEPNRGFDWRDHLATIGGLIVSILMAWQTVDFITFKFDAAHIMSLLVAAAPAIGGFVSKFKKA